MPDADPVQAAAVPAPAQTATVNPVQAAAVPAPIQAATVSPVQAAAGRAPAQAATVNPVHAAAVPAPIQAATVSPVEAAAVSVSTPAPASGLPAGASIQDRWRKAVEAVRAFSPRHGASLAFGRLISLQPGQVTLAFPAEAAFHRAAVVGSGREKLEKVLSEHFGQRTQLTVDSTPAPSNSGESLAEIDKRERQTRERSAETRLREHPAVRATLKILGGEIEHLQILEKE